MKKIFICMMTLFWAFSLLAQNVTLTFTGRDASNHFLPLNRVEIANATRSWQETIYYPDTVLIMGLVGVENYENANGFELLQNNPNPFEESTIATLRTVEKGEVTLALADMNGRTVESSKKISLQPGIHQFRIHVAHPGTYMLTASQNGKSASIKMVCTGKGSENRIECIASVGTQEMATLQSKGATDQPFSMGDDMLYTGYAMVNGTEQESQTIHQNQFGSESFVLNFNVTINNDGVPCPDAPIVTDYDGNSYQTVQIGQQCWMRENLRTTHYSDGTGIALGSGTSTDVAYRYYPNNSSSNVNTYGYLYNWKAVIRNSSTTESNPSGVQGICPTGWHVPSDAEWTQLTNYVKSQPAYVCEGCSGTDDEWTINCIAKALASATGWITSAPTCAVGNNPGSNNATGFSAVPAGDYFGSYSYFGSTAAFWSATQYDSSYASNYHLNYYYAYVYRDYYSKSRGFSVRCLRD